MLHEAQDKTRYEKNGQDDDFWVGIPEAADMIPGSVPIGIEDTATTLSLLNNGTTHFEANDPLTPAMLPVTPGSATAGTQDAGDDADAEDGDQAWRDETGDDGTAPDGTDPLGSWTGTPADEDELPTQDADDL